MRTILALGCAALLFACGDDDSTTDAGEDTGGVDAASDTGGDDAGEDDAGADTGAEDAGGDDAGVCDDAVEDEPCDAEGTSCGGELCTDECSFCNILTCDEGTWTRLEAFPAPCFSCGPELQCPLDTDYCSVVIGGPAGSEPSYTCAEYPEACAAEPTCECLEGDGLPGDCAGDAETGITITLAAP